MLEKNGVKTGAFVCYENPESSSLAKASLSGFPLAGRQLHVNHYEIKEQRQLNREEMTDKSGFQQYLQQNSKSQGMDMNQIINRPEIMSLIQHLVTMMQRNLQPRLNNRQNYRQQVGPRFNYNQNNQHQQSYIAPPNIRSPIPQPQVVNHFFVNPYAQAVQPHQQITNVPNH